MTTVTFGDADDHAVVFYDRGAQLCVVVANAQTHVSDAIAVVNSIKVDRVLIIAPKDTDLTHLNVSKKDSLEVFEYVK